MAEYISKETVLRALGDAMRVIATEGIEDLPSVQSERKTGKWIVISAPDDSHCGLIQCPFCGDELVEDADKCNYCQNCGARLKGAKE